MELNHDQAHLWYVRDDELDPALLGDVYDSLITPDEQARHNRYKLAKDQRLFLATRWLERTTLSRYEKVAPEAWRFHYDTNGRPEIATPHVDGLKYSLSHSKGMVLMGLTRQRAIGVDVQFMEPLPDLLKVARVFCSAQELERIDKAGTDTQSHELFYEIWTVKEAYLKAIGTGMQIAPARCTVTRTHDHHTRIESPASLGSDPPDSRPNAWLSYDWRIDANYHAAAVVLKKSNDPISLQLRNAVTQNPIPHILE